MLNPQLACPSQPGGQVLEELFIGISLLSGLIRQPLLLVLPI
jgi:hypothetical protein